MGLRYTKKGLYASIEAFRYNYRDYASAYSSIEGHEQINVRSP